MGLDWNPMPRAKPGSEAEFERLMRIDLDELDEVDCEARAPRLSHSSESPWPTS
jgi:hypothetical protein